MTLILMMIIAAGLGVGLWWWRQRVMYYRKQFEAAEGFRLLSLRQEAILAAVPDIIMEVDINKVYKWANRAGLEFFGEDVVGKEAAYYFEGEQDTYDAVQPLFNGDENKIYIESWQRRKDGEKRLLAWWCLVLKDEQGNVKGALSSAQDITERRKAEEALRSTNLYNRSLIEASLDPLVTIGPDGKITDVNLATEKVTGRSRGELIGTDFSDYFTEPERARAGYKQVFTEGLVRDYPLEIRHRDGNITDVLYNASVYRDGKGQVIGVFAAARDVTERKKAEEFIKSILDSVDEGFIIIDSDYRIITANRAYCEQVKAPDCDIIGRHCHEVSHHSEKPCFMADEECAPWQTFKTGEPHRAIHTHYDKEGLPVYVEIKSFPMKDSSGKIIGVIETLNNITEKRRLEGQLRHAQKMEAIGTLVGGIAHDFNNMLNIIIGYAGLIEMRMKQDDTMGPQIKEILAAGDRAAQLTQGLLTFSRKQVLEIKTVNINEIVEGFEKMLRRIIGEDIELHIVQKDEDLIARADRGQIEQVLMNLAANARDAMPKGGIFTIETRRTRIDREFIKAHGYGEPGRYALITVSDTGIGMDENTRERIFEPYFTTKETGRGTGLGLAIAYGIVTQHSGYIHCYSEPGKGTTFRLYIPLVREEADKIEKEEAIVPKSGTETILVAEDDAAVRNLIINILEVFGYKTIVAVDGEDAVNKFRANKDIIQLLLFDLIMPKKNGKDAFEEIKAIKNDISVIFMSGYASDIIQRYGIEEGVEFISKPVLPNELLRKIRVELDR